MRLHHLLVLTTLMLAGCGSKSENTFSEVGQRVGGGAPKKAAAPEAKEPPAQVPANQEEAPAVRKIIYTAKMELIVEDFHQAQKSLLELVDQHGGYVANSESRGAPGSPRSGTWTVRVPENKFRSFLTELESLGEPQRNTIDSQDVTDEFYDLEARVRNKKVEEERLLEHLKKSTGRLEDILAVEREISRVRGEIEQSQGRLQKLAKLTALTTVTVTL